MHWILAFTLLACSRAAPGAPFTSRGIDSLNNPDWMARLPDGRNLAELSFPGTHESLSIHGGGLFECQEDHGDSAETLTAQLNAGIRVFDIRVRITDGGKFTVHHASHYMNANFDDVLTKLKSFLEVQKSETALLRVKQECTGGPISCNDAEGNFVEIFRSYANGDYSSLFWSPSISGGSADVPNLGDVRGKTVLVVLNGKNGGRYDNFGLAQFYGWDDKSSDFVQDEYEVPNIGAIATKRDQVRRFLDKTSAGDKTKMYINFASGSSSGAWPETVASGAPSITGVNPFLIGYLRESEDVHPKVVRTGVMMMDFPPPDLVTQIINVNVFVN